MRSRFSGVALGVATLWTAVAATDGGRGRPYRFVEESHRLPPSSEPPGTSTTGAHLADVDRDGDLDLFLAEGTAGLDPRPNKLYLNDGAGWFTDASATHLPSAHANSTRADFADVDGDGDLDALVANVGPEQLLLNDGAGRFRDASGQLPPPAPILQSISANAQLADVDGDGCADALISNEDPFDPSPSGGAQNFLWLNTRAAGRCTGVFVDATAARLPAATEQTASMLAGDLDGDGDLDLVVLNRGQERVLINDGAGVFVDQTAARFPVTADSTRGGALVDLDRDGALDLVTSNSRNQPPRVYWNDGHGAFAPGSFGHTPEPDETDTELLVADLDGDRRPDVYIGNAGRFDAGHGFEGGPDHLFEGRPGRGFADVSELRADFPAIQASTAAAFGDLDGDGDLDLVVAGTGDGEVGRERIFLQRHRGHDACHGAGEDAD
jgi:hypothetical protein